VIIVKFFNGYTEIHVCGVVVVGGGGVGELEVGTRDCEQEKEKKTAGYRVKRKLTFLIAGEKNRFWNGGFNRMSTVSFAPSLPGALLLALFPTKEPVVSLD